MNSPTPPPAPGPIDEAAAPGDHLTADDFDFLDDELDLLRETDDYIPDWEFCEGFLAALVCTRREIGPEEYWPALLGDDFKPMAHMEFIWRVRRRISEITAALDAPVETLEDPRTYHPEVLDVRGGLLAERADAADAADAAGAAGAVNSAEGVTDAGADAAAADVAADVAAAATAATNDGNSDSNSDSNSNSNSDSDSDDTAEPNIDDIDPSELPSFAQTWAIGFLTVIDLWAQDWSDPRDREAAKLYMDAVEAIGRVAMPDTGVPAVSMYAEDCPPSMSQRRLDDFGNAIWAVYDLRQMWKSLGPRIEPLRKVAEPGRNDPCTCGSGKKFKKCCGAN